jgi:uncharacterized delta-60 repeat protein
MKAIQTYRIGIVFLIILLLSNSIFAAGVLDPSFGNGGVVMFRYGGTTDGASSGALQTDGKIILVGSTGPSGQSGGFRDFAVARLNADGSLDNTFGTGGLVATPFGTLQEDNAQGVAIQPDGKILVGGYTDNFLAFARYNPNGSLDTAFGTGGKVVTDVENTVRDNFTALFLRPDGKFLVVGFSAGTAESQVLIMVIRYNANGSLDTTFGSNGKLKIYFSPGGTTLHGAAMQPDGKLLIAGEYVYNIPGCVPDKTTVCYRYQPFLLRYDQRMRLDKKFARLGKLFSSDQFQRIAVLSNGDILVEGLPRARLFSFNGVLKTTFDAVLFPGQSPNVATGAYLAAQRPNGTIAACHYHYSNGYDDIGMVLFGSDGHLIGTDYRDFFGGTDYCGKVLVQPDGKILVVGATQLQQQGSSAILAMRYTDIVP